MLRNDGWQELYRAALLELHPQFLRQRIDDAHTAIQTRLVELRRDDSNSAEELRALDDALRGLGVLARDECQLPLSGFGSMVQNRAAS